MKICTVCQISKKPSEYYFKNKTKGKLHSQCKGCYSMKRKLFMEAHYLKYGDAYRRRARARSVKIRRERVGQYLQYLSDKSCEQCGINNLCVLDFDHIDPKTKRFGIARAVNDGYAWSEILNEIQMCRILCANCHRIRTAEQFGWMKWRVGGAVTRRSAKP